MKKNILVFSLVFAFIVGCQENNSIVDPANSNEVTSLAKANDTFATDLYHIDGSEGGKIKVKYNWVNSRGKNSKLKAVLDIPAKSFTGSKDFQMVFNLESNSVELYPSGSFDKPLSFSLKLKNVNVDYSDLDFKYLDGNETPVYESNLVDVEQGNLEVKKAQLHHFSEWGWGR